MMHFRITYTVQKLFLGDGVSHRFVYTKPRRTTLTLRPPSAKEQEEGHAREAVFCRAGCGAEPSTRVKAMFRSLERGKLPPGSQNPRERGVDREGRIKENYVVPIWCLPEPFQSFCNQLEGELSDLVERTVSVLRWRTGASGPHNPLGFRDFQWSLDGRKWRSVPHATRAYLTVMRPPRLNSEEKAHVRRLVAAGESEPLGHNLLREAESQKDGNPRSCLILTVAAVEVGFKKLVGDLVPGAAWLADNVPNPPLIRMFTEFLPRLPVRSTLDGGVFIPKGLTNVLKKGIALRNTVAHAGIGDVRRDFLDDLIPVAQDTLWLLDFYAGEDWALNHVRSETKEAMGIR